MSDHSWVPEDLQTWHGGVQYTATYDDGTWVRGLPGNHKIGPSPALVALLMKMGAAWEAGKAGGEA